jgi:Transposase DDE domain group 1
MDGHRVSSDAGCVLVGQLDRSFGITKRFATCFKDRRNQDLIEHEILTLIRQRVYGLVGGYEDLNDHDWLRVDPLLAAACGQEDVFGQERRREEDRGKGLAGKSTFNRMELGAGLREDDRYKRIQADLERIEDFFIGEFVASVKKNTPRLILDLDTSCAPVHGEQEQRFFHGYYDQYCLLPLFMFCGAFPVAARLRSAEREHLDDTLRLLEKVVKRLRQKRPRVQIVLRGDSGFCRVELMRWCEAQRVDFVLGLQGNAVLKRICRGVMRSAKSMLEFNRPKGSAAERLFKEFKYRARDWKADPKRRVICKAECTLEGENPRFVISNLPAEQFPMQPLYEQTYCGRGNMENRIKEQFLDLKVGRISTHYVRSNQLRMAFSTVAYLLMHHLRSRALKGTDMERATCGTLRQKLLKVGAVVRLSCRRLLVSISAAYPYQEIWSLAARRLLNFGFG